jgi:MoaA/NifB/PqqE/SkfB family radical SAM enzyme
MLSVGTIDRVLQEAEGLGIDGLRITGGEPLVRPDFAGVLEAVNGRNFKKAVLVTNGLLLDRYVSEINGSALTQISVSLDGLEADHDEIRGVPGAFRRVMEALPRIKKNIKINSLLTNTIVDHLEELIDLCHTNGYSFGYGTPLRHGPPFFLSGEVGEAIDRLTPTTAERERIFEILTKHQVASPRVLRSAREFMESGRLDFDHCINPYVLLMVYWNGQVRAGCFGFQAVGDVHHQSLAEILSSGSYVRDARRAYDMACARECVACTLSSAAASPLSSLPYVLSRFR